MKNTQNTETLILKTEKQRDEYIDRLDRARVEYSVSTTRDNVFSQDISYIIRVRAEDLKKVS